MKRGLFAVYISLTLFLSGCNEPTGLDIKGAWQLVSVKYMVGDTVKWTKTSASPDEGGIKMWSDNYFVCVYRFSDKSRYDYSFSGGTYKLEGNKYEETINYHHMINISDMVGLKEMMLMEIRNDTLIQTYPVDENGKLLDRYTIIEKLVRLDQP